MAGFDSLSPDAVIMAVEAAFDREFQSVITPYPSYVNRVYGMTDIDGDEYVAKFYRPGRWESKAIEDEHRFMLELVDQEFPVVPPLPDSDGDTLAEVILETSGKEEVFRFALFPKKAGRLFDAEDDESWIRIGALCGRLHNVGSKGQAGNRITWSPTAISSRQIEWILNEGVLPPDMEAEFRQLSNSALEMITPLFESTSNLRLHGDLHRGNILDRGDEGLLLIDLDDMVNGPAMQDLWLLLPGRHGEVGRETGLLSEGYEEFRPFPWNELRLMEPLRLMRMIHFIAWCARQREDRDFFSNFPDWGSRSWWIQELEDMRDQITAISESLA